MTKATDILDEIDRRLNTITTTNGYHSDVGQRNYSGWDARALPEDEQRPLIAWHLISDAQRVLRSCDGKNTLRIVIEAHADYGEPGNFDPTTRWQVILLEIVHDVRRALFVDGDDVKLGGLATDMSEPTTVGFTEPESGSDLALAGITVDVEYIEKYEATT